MDDGRPTSSSFRSCRNKTEAKNSKMALRTLLSLSMRIFRWVSLLQVIVIIKKINANHTKVERAVDEGT